MNQLLILSQNETQQQKRIKKTLFIFISIVFPIIEILYIILETKDLIENNTTNLYFELNYSIFYFFSFASILCTWAMMSCCYNEIKNIILFIFLKIAFTIIALFYIRKEVNIHYYLVFNAIGYGIFFTLISLHKTFKKGVI